MKATYNDLLISDPNCSKFSSDQDAIAVFNFLNQDDRLL